MLYFTANFSDGPRRTMCNCTDGSSSAAGKCAHGGAEGATFVSWASTPSGPWSPPLQLISEGSRQSDTNLAPTILALVGAASAPQLEAMDGTLDKDAGTVCSEDKQAIHGTPRFLAVIVVLLSISIGVQGLAFIAWLVCSELPGRARRLASQDARFARDHEEKIQLFQRMDEEGGRS